MLGPPTSFIALASRMAWAQGWTASARAPLIPGHAAVEGIFLANRADVMLGYCSGSAAVMHAVRVLPVFLSLHR